MTPTDSLWEQFKALDLAKEDGAIAAIPCGSDVPHLLVRGDRGEPALLFATETRATPRADIRLKHVGVQFDRRFEVANMVAGSIDAGNFCKFICDPSVPHLHQYFVELMAATASTNPGILTSTANDEIVSVLLELFRKLSLPSEKSVSGLWGELLVIHLAATPDAFVDAWHIRTTDRFDFAFPNFRIEVKTTEQPSRDHEFSLKQVRSGRESDFVASVKLSRSSAGLSVLDMARLITSRLDSNRQAKLWRTILETIGDDCDDEQRFDLISASEDLVFVRCSDIPAPNVAAGVDAFVTQVRFRSNINLVCEQAEVDKTLFLGA